MKHTALITGASRGIGAALACRFAAEGYHLALCCHNSYETLQALATKLETTCSIQVLCFRGDVGDYTFICDMVQKTLDTFGQIDVLINNAGISYIGLLTDMDITDWNQLRQTSHPSFPPADRSSLPWFMPNPDISSIFLLYGEMSELPAKLPILHAKAGSIPLHALWAKNLPPAISR